MKKILQVIPYSYHIHLGWLEKIAQTMSDWLNGYDDGEVQNRSSDIVKWWILNHANQSDTLFMPSFDLVSWFPVPKIRQKQFRKQFSLLKKWQPDIIITHTRFFLHSMLGWILAKLRWCKRIHVEHGSWFVQGYPWWIKISAWFFDRTLGLWIFRQCDTIVTISQMHKHFIRKFTAKEPVVIYNPIDFIPKPKIKNAIPHIGFVGRLVPLKWVDFLINALVQIKAKDWICTIVWEGSERSNLEDLVVTKWLQERIHFIWADDRVNRLHRFDIFVNPSYQEWVPTTVVEALIAWCIVVATDVGGTREISTEDDLILVESCSSEKITSWIEQAFSCLGISWKSVAWVKEKFGIGSAMNFWRQVINYWK
jgi:glycosyltransferase involved in cell wall biosynthesis